MNMDQPGALFALACFVVGGWAWLMPLSPAPDNELPPVHSDDPAGSNAWEAQWDKRLSSFDRKIWTQRVAIVLGVIALLMRYGVC